MANLITLVRTIMSFLVVALLQVQRTDVYLAAVALTLLLIWLDAVDGWVARRLGEASRAGAVIDILGDRVVEMTYWIGFVALGWLPAWVAIVIAARGTIVDGLRSLSVEQGLTPFAAAARTRLGAILVSSRFSRGLYGVGKAVAFSLLILVFTPGIPRPSGAILAALAYTSVVLTVALCLIRGAPALADARLLLRQEREPTT